jgi:hypothetical protein
LSRILSLVDNYKFFCAISLIAISRNERLSVTCPRYLPGRKRFAQSTRQPCLDSVSLLFYRAATFWVPSSRLEHSLFDRSTPSNITTMKLSSVLLLLLPLFALASVGQADDASERDVRSLQVSTRADCNDVTRTNQSHRMKQ